MGEAYPEIVEHARAHRADRRREEERFGATLRQGLAFLEEAIERRGAPASGVFDGSVAFALHDTYGFPVELTAEIAAEARPHGRHGRPSRPRWTRSASAAARA